jgi:hypothetical protein
VPGQHGFAVRSHPSSPKGFAGQGAVVCVLVDRSRKSSALQSHSRLTLPCPPQPAQRSWRWPTPLWAGRDGKRCAPDLPDLKSEIFLILGLDTSSENQKWFASSAPGQLIYPGATHDFDDPGTKRQEVPANAAAAADVTPRAIAFFASVLKAQGARK